MLSYAELWKLEPFQYKTLLDKLNSPDSCKKLMDAITDKDDLTICDSTISESNNGDISTVEYIAPKSERNPVEAVLDQWSSKEKESLTLEILFYLLLKAELFEAACDVYELLNGRKSRTIILPAKTNLDNIAVLVKQRRLLLNNICVDNKLYKAIKIFPDTFDALLDNKKIVDQNNESVEKHTDNTLSLKSKNPIVPYGFLPNGHIKENKSNSKSIDGIPLNIINLCNGIDESDTEYNNAKPNIPKHITKQYSLAIEANRMLYISGMTGLIPATDTLITGGVAAETRQALLNIKTILDAVQTGFDEVVKMTVLLTNLKDVGAVNKVYTEFFKLHMPTINLCQVSKLPMGAQVQIDATAVIGPMIPIRVIIIVFGICLLACCLRLWI